MESEKSGLKRIHMTHRNKSEDVEEIRICHGDIDYQGIMKHINDGVVIIREGKIVFANNAFYEISQKGPEQVIGSDFSDFISAADWERVTRYCTERLFTEGMSDTIEFVMPRRGWRSDHRDEGQHCRVRGRPCNTRCIDGYHRTTQDPGRSAKGQRTA